MSSTDPIEWSFEPSVVLGSFLLVGWYLLSVGPRRHRFSGSAPVPIWRIAAFVSGVLTIFLALSSPLDALSDGYLLTAHMTQHMLMTLVLPPLLLWGTPGWLIRPLLRSPVVAVPSRFLTRPLTAFVVFNVTFAFTHFPVIYNLSLQDQGVHVAQHLAYMTVGIIKWWPLLSPLPELPRLAYPMQMLYLFLNTIPGAIVGSFITLSETVLYPTYAAAPRVSSLTPQGDQQLAGLIMWVVSSTLYFIAITVLFFIWAHRENTRKLEPAR